MTREADRGALRRQAAVVAAGVLDVLSDHDRQLIADCHRAALAALHPLPDDSVQS